MLRSSRGGYIQNIRHHTSETAGVSSGLYKGLSNIAASIIQAYMAFIFSPCRTTFSFKIVYGCRSTTILAVANLTSLEVNGREVESLDRQETEGRQNLEFKGKHLIWLGRLLSNNESTTCVAELFQKCCVYIHERVARQSHIGQG